VITRQSLGLQARFEAPVGELEELIAGAFAEVFELDRVGAHDEFFDLGGDSLLGEVLSNLISEGTGRDFKISDLIEHGSPRHIARLLSAKSSQPAARQAKRPPIFLVHGRKGFILPKPEFRQALAGGQELYVFELPGIRGGPSYDRIEDVAAVYVTQLVERYPQGPILLASFCVGALIAIEMASQLAKIGRPVGQLVLLDPGLPKNRPQNIKREIKNKARLAHGGAYRPSKTRLGAQLLLHRLHTFGRWLTRKNADFAEDLLRFRNRLLSQEQRGRSKLPGQPQAIDARAKLHAALRHYRPRIFDGPVTILCSPERDPNYPWNGLLPRRRVQQVFEKHEVSSAVAARFLQSTFDAALAELGSPTVPGLGSWVSEDTPGIDLGRKSSATHEA
jgi:thioesterase domain-containing protein